MWGVILYVTYYLLKGKQKNRKREKRDRDITTLSAPAMYMMGFVVLDPAMRIVISPPELGSVLRIRMVGRVALRMAGMLPVLVHVCFL